MWLGAWRFEAQLCTNDAPWRLEPLVVRRRVSLTGLLVLLAVLFGGFRLNGAVCRCGLGQQKRLLEGSQMIKGRFVRSPISWRESKKSINQGPWEPLTKASFGSTRGRRALRKRRPFPRRTSRGTWRGEPGPSSASRAIHGAWRSGLRSYDIMAGFPLLVSARSKKNNKQLAAEDGKSAGCVGETGYRERCDCKGGRQAETHTLACVTVQLSITTGLRTSSKRSWTYSLKSTPLADAALS